MAQPNQLPSDGNVFDLKPDLVQPWMPRVDAAVDANPEEASRAVDVADATGQNPAAVSESLEASERRLKQDLSHQIVASDPWLQQYINQHPIAAPLANDDLAAMKKAGESYDKLATGAGRPWWETEPVTIMQTRQARVGAAAFSKNIFLGGIAKPLAAFGHMIGSENLVGVVKRFEEQFDKDIPITDEEKNSMNYLVNQGLGQIAALLIGGTAGGVRGAAVQMGLQTAEEEAEKAEKAGADWQTPFTGGFAIGTAMGMAPLGTLEKIAGKAGPGIEGWLLQRFKEAAATGSVLTLASEVGTWAATQLEKGTFDPYAEYHPDSKRMLANMIGGAILGPTFGSIKSFIDAGERIPIGAHPMTDAIAIEKTKVDNEALDNALKDAASTAMKGRQPEYLAKYYKLRPEATIGIDGNKALELYGTKEPGPGDGLLGDMVPNIAEQLKAAARDGSDIEVPLPDYVAKVDPKLDKELHDFRRVDAHGLTLDDVKNFYAAGSPEGGGDTEVPPVFKAEEPRLGGIARSGDPTIDSLRAQMGMDKILPVPVEKMYDFTPGPGVIPRDLSALGPAVRRTALDGEYTVLKEYRGGDLLRATNADHLEGVPKVLAQFFSDRLMKTVDDIPVQVVTRDEMRKIFSDIFRQRGSAAGFYWAGSDSRGQAPRIVIRDDVLNGSQGTDYANHVLIHEMAHAASVRAIHNDPVLSKDLLDLRNETLKWLKANDPDALDNIGINYAFSDPGGKEYIAQAYSEPDFQNQLARIPVSPELAKRLGHPAATNIWDLARNLIKRALEKIFGTKLPPTAMDELFTMGERFEAALDSRKPELRPVDEDKPEQPPISPEERQLYQDHKALGYTKDHWNRIKEKLAEQRAEDNEFQRQRALKDAEKRQTERWKQNAAELRPVAEGTVYGRPAIRADRFFRLGILDGDKVTRQRLDGSVLEPGMKDLLSPEWYNKKGGLKPDDIAGVLGYRSGESMLSDLTLMKSEMDKAGLTHNAFIESRIEAEVSRRMAAKYGSLQDQILADAKDHIINDGQFQLLHEDTLRLATKLNFEAPFTKEQVQAMAREDLDSQRQGSFKSTRQADNTGRIGRKIEDAENKGDAQEVMKLAGQREISFYKTLYGREFEKLDAKFDKIAKNHKKIDPSAFRDPEAAAYHDFIQLLLGDVGKPINRKYEDVKHEFEQKGYPTFRDFVKEQWDNHDEFIPAPDWILDGQHQKPFKDMTIGEAKSYMNLVIALDKLGRERMKVNTAYGMKELEPAWNAAIEEIGKQYDVKGRTASGETAIKTGELGKTGQWYIVGSRVMERILSRLDYDKPRGVFNQYVIRPIKDGEAHWEDLKRDYGKKFRELGPPEDMHKAIDAPFKNPYDGNEFVHFERKNLLAIMLNMGSVENWNKFTKGWKTDPQLLATWVNSHATKADWDWVQGVWKIFSEMKGELDTAYRNTTGTPPGTKEFRAIQTPFGAFEGGYYPLVHDKIALGKGSKIASYEVNDGPGFFQQNIPNPHAKEVTGADYPVSMDLDALPSKFDQIAFDIAMREPLHGVKKFLTYKPLRQEIRNRMGVEYDKEIDSWLHDVSHSAEYNTAASIQGNKVSQFFRQNVIGYLVGANISTVLKHGPTAAILSLRQEPKYILKGYASLFKANPVTGDSWWKWMNENAQEIQRRDRYWAETYGGVYKEFDVGGNTLFGYGEPTIRDTVIKWGSKPVAFSDKLSAKPLWLGAYMHALDDGMDIGEAKFEADRAVRFAHGSTAVSNLPGFVRGRGIQSWFTSLYGFFGTVLQNRMEIAYKFNDMYRLGREGELKKAAKILPLIAADTFAYVIAPTWIEEYVTGLTTDDRRGWGQHAVWATAGGLANSFLGFRDLTHMLEYGMTDTGGLLSSAVKPFTRMFKDISREDHSLSREHAGDLIEDVLSLAGLSIGLPKEVGNLAKYGWNTMIADKEQPYTGLMENWNKYGDLGRGIFRGTQKKTVRK